MSAKPETAKGSRPTSRRIEHVRVRYRAPFALRCGAILIDYIVLALILTFSTLVARLMGGALRQAESNIVNRSAEAHAWRGARLKISGFCLPWSLRFWI